MQLREKLGGRSYRFLLLAAGAFVTGITLVFPQVGILEWIGLIPAIIALINISKDEKIRKRGLYGYGFFFFFCGGNGFFQSSRFSFRLLE